MEKDGVKAIGKIHLYFKVVKHCLSEKKSVKHTGFIISD